MLLLGFDGFPCVCLFGGGGGFFAAPVGVGVTDLAAFGGVGGRDISVVSMSSGSCMISGTLPADSRSKTLSLSSLSTANRAGAGGSGLFTSEGVGGLANFECEEADEPEPDRLSSSVAYGFFSLSFSSILMSLPCRESGGGGFFRSNAGVDCSRGLEDGSRALSSSPASEISCEVRGVSCAPYVASKIDWRDIEEASVMLAASPPDTLAACGLDELAGGTLLSACPVIRSLPKELTSSEPFPTGAGVVATAVASEDTPAGPGSRSSSVF
jgi:hypothetical protein